MNPPVIEFRIEAYDDTIVGTVLKGDKISYKHEKLVGGVIGVFMSMETLLEWQKRINEIVESFDMEIMK